MGKGLSSAYSVPDLTIQLHTVCSLVVSVTNTGTSLNLALISLRFPSEFQKVTISEDSWQQKHKDTSPGKFITSWPPHSQKADRLFKYCVISELYTWTFGSTLCNASKSKHNSAFILLYNLQRRKFLNDGDGDDDY